MTLFLLFLGGVCITLYMVFQTTASLNSLITLHKVEIIRQNLVINVQTVQSNLYTTGTLFGKELDVIVDNVIQFSGTAKGCVNCHHEPEVDKELRDLIAMSGQYREALSYFITSTADVQRIERLQAVAADIGDSIITKAQNMALMANENLRQKTMAASAKVSKSKNILAMTIIASFILSLTIAVYLIKSITGPISELIQATRKIRAGDLGYTSNFQGRDEFKELFGSFNDMSTTLKESNEGILAQMALNQTILQTSVDGFMLLDDSGAIIGSNPALSEISGYAQDEILSMNLADLKDPDASLEVEGLLAEIRQSSSMIFEMSQKRKDGGLIATEISVTHVEMEGEGKFFCFVRNISERKRMEAEFLKIQKLESLGVLAGGIAHDFNNLLTAMVGNIDLARRKIDPSGKAYQFLENARKASDRAQNLTQQLLTFSRGGSPVKQVIKLNGLIEDAVGFTLSGSNVKCELNLPENLWLVEADSGQISQVVQNITLNASQAMPGGGTIKVSAENVVVDENWLPLSMGKGNCVKLTFVDEGVGIPGKYLTKIFDPYFTTKQSGNGLGLTICHSIINKHNGRLAVDSKPGEGSVFTIYLPALGVAGARDDKSHEESMVIGSGTVLVMDDEAFVRDIAAAILSELGYKSDFALNGREAIDLYRKAMQAGQPYVAVIMDLTIPGGMGGKEAIRELLAIDPAVKAIVSSGYSYDPIMAEHKKYGFSGVVAKPYDVDQISKILKDMLKG